MRYVVTSVAAALIAGCAKPEAPPAEAPAPPAAAAALNPADLAGTWTFKTMPETGDSVLVTYTITATGNAEGWTINFPGRQPMPFHITFSGDSATTRVEPYESVLRKGVQVSVDGVLRLVDGKLIGGNVAHYAGVKGADSVVKLRAEGTRNP